MFRRKTLFLAAALVASTSTYANERPLPGADMMAPGSNVLGTPDYGKDVKVAGAAAAASPDKNGDGFVDAAEAEPGSQLAKRLKTRDTNGDGKLSRDEYFFK